MLAALLLNIPAGRGRRRIVNVYEDEEEETQAAKAPNPLKDAVKRRIKPLTPDEEEAELLYILTQLGD